MPFKPSDELVMRFTASEWNQVIAQLQEGPYRLVAPLINKINMQAAQQEQAANAPQTVEAGDITYTNGELLQAQPDLQQGQ